MKKPTDMGMNRTGLATSPIDKREMLENEQVGTPIGASPGGIATERIEYVSDAPPVGTVPPPVTLKGAAKAVAKALAGEKATVLIDRLGARIAFERAGARLYEAVLAKRRAGGDGMADPAVIDLERIHREEIAHVHLLREAIESLGADPTALTPGADVTAVSSMGLMQVVTDPRTTVGQSLEAMLVAELADNDGWMLLIDLTRAMGQDEMARRFETALVEEEEHLRLVRAWVAGMTRRDAQLLPTSGPQPTAH